MRTNRRSKWILARRSWQMYLFLLLPLVYLIIFKYIPMAGVQIAFRQYSARLGHLAQQMGGNEAVFEISEFLSV